MPFKVDVLICPVGHREIAMAGHFNLRGPGSVCGRCYRPLDIWKRVEVVPGRRHSEMPCNQDGRRCELVF